MRAGRLVSGWAPALWHARAHARRTHLGPRTRTGSTRAAACARPAGTPAPEPWPRSRARPAARERTSARVPGARTHVCVYVCSVCVYGCRALLCVVPACHTCAPRLCTRPHICMRARPSPPACCPTCPGPHTRVHTHARPHLHAARRVKAQDDGPQLRGGPHLHAAREARGHVVHPACEMHGGGGGMHIIHPAFEMDVCVGGGGRGLGVHAMPRGSTPACCGAAACCCVVRQPRPQWLRHTASTQPVC